MRCLSLASLLQKCLSHAQIQAPLITPVALALALSGLAFAQSSDSYAGSPAFVTSVRGQFDSVSLPYGNILVEFPIRSKTGKYPLTYGLVGNSHMCVGPPNNSNYFTGMWLASYGVFARASGSQFSSNLNTVVNPTSSTASPCQLGSENIYSGFSVAETNGTKHPFQPGVSVYSGPCATTSVTATTTDNSGYTMRAQGQANGSPQLTLWDKSGNVLQSSSCPNGVCITDSDGISLTGSLYGSGNVVDTLGQNIVTSTVTYGLSGDRYTYNDVSGNPQTINVNYSQIPQVTAFSCGSIQELPPNDVYFPTSIVYPNGETVNIGYEQNSLTSLPAWRASYLYSFATGHNCLAALDTNGNLEGVKTVGTSGPSQPVWNTTVGGQTTDGTVVWQNYGHTWTSGRIGSITYPQGGSVSYAYSGIVVNPEGQFNGVTNYATWPAQITRTVNDNNGNSDRWIYQISTPTSNNGTVTVTETDPANNATVLYFAGATQTGSGVPSNCITGYLTGCAYTYIQTAKLSYKGAATASNLIGEQVTCYNLHNSSESACITPTVPITFPIQYTDVYTHPIGSNGAIGSPNDVETGFDPYGNTAFTSYYDFGVTFPPSGSPASVTSILYDGQNASCGTLAVAAMHDRPCSVIVSGSSGTVSRTNYTYNSAGHATQTSTLVSGSTYLTSNASYNPNGNVATATDANGATTHYYYNGTGGCNNLLLTSTVLPVDNLTTSQTWDCSGGVLTSVKDANGQTTNYGYVNQSGTADPMWRRLSTTDPLNNVTWNTFNTTSLPFTAESSLTFNSNLSTVDTLTTLDGIGQPLFVQTRKAPGSSSFDSVQYTYGWTANVGAFKTATVPYVGTQGQSAPVGTAVTTTQNDALGRTQSVTDGGGGYTNSQYILQDVLVTVGPAPVRIPSAGNWNMTAWGE